MPKKTEVVMFTRSKRTFQHQVRMDGQLIPYSNSVVYLGVTMDSELKWRLHIEKKVVKAKNLIMKLAAITNAYWGPKLKLMRWKYTGIVRPMISYGAMYLGRTALLTLSGKSTVRPSVLWLKYHDLPQPEHWRSF